MRSAQRIYPVIGALAGRALSEGVLLPVGRRAVRLLLLAQPATVDPPAAPGTARRPRRRHPPRFERHVWEAQDHRRASAGVA